MACKPLMCWSTGREPIAQPPGKDTLARPKRASNGPSANTEARMVLTNSYGASGFVKVPAFKTTLPSSWRSAVTPILRMSLSMVATSCKCGTLASVTGWSVNKAAHSSGKAAFLAPEISTSPCKALPPRIRSLSMPTCLPFQRRSSFPTQWGCRCASTKHGLRRSPCDYPKWRRRAGGVGSNACLQTLPRPRWHTNGGRPLGLADAHREGLQR